MTHDRRANRLPRATESNLAPVAQLRISNGLSHPSLTHSPKGCESGRSDRITRALTVMQDTAAQERFWSKVTKLNGHDACWVWHSSLNAQGYGQFWIKSLFGNLPAHRLSYALTHGPIPDRLCVCHHCDNPICVRPDHLFLGTHADNIRDMHKKGRGVLPQRKPTRTRTLQLHLRVGLV